MTQEAEQSLPVVEINNLSFRWSPTASPILNIKHWQVVPGERWCIYGPSGTGKTTLLNLLTGLLKPSDGEIAVLGTTLSHSSAAQRDRLRADHLGYIFQQFNLLPYLSVIDNVRLSVQLSALRREKNQRYFASIESEAEHWLDTLGLPKERWRESVLRLSIGQQQRVAAARALMGSPELIIADEPTSALDADNAERFVAALNHACQERQTALIMVSHDVGFREQFDQLWDLKQETQL